MKSTPVFQRSYVNWPLVTAATLGGSVLAIACTYFGAVYQVQCSRASGQCQIEGRTLFFPEPAQRVALNDITGVRVDVSESTSEITRPNSRRRQSVVTKTSVLRFLLKPNLTGPLRDDVILDDRSALDDQSDVARAGAELQSFVADPGRAEVSVSFGSYRTGIYFAVVALLGCMVVGVGAGFTRLKLETRRLTLRNGGIDSRRSDDDVIEAIESVVSIKPLVGDAWVAYVRGTDETRGNVGKSISTYLVGAEPNRIASTSSMFPRLTPRAVRRSLQEQMFG